jgi:hypothetical protein
VTWFEQKHTLKKNSSTANMLQGNHAAMWVPELQHHAFAHKHPLQASCFCSKTIWQLVLGQVAADGRSTFPLTFGPTAASSGVLLNVACTTSGAV